MCLRPRLWAPQGQRPSYSAPKSSQGPQPRAQSNCWKNSAFLSLPSSPFSFRTECSDWTWALSWEPGTRKTAGSGCNNRSTGLILAVLPAPSRLPSVKQQKGRHHCVRRRCCPEDPSQPWPWLTLNLLPNETHNCLDCILWLLPVRFKTFPSTQPNILTFNILRWF